MAENTITFTYTSTNPNYPSGTVEFTGDNNIEQMRQWIYNTIGDGRESATYRLLTGTLSGNAYYPYQYNNLFRDCSALTSLDVSGLNIDNLPQLYYMFLNCSSLTSLDLSSFNTSNVTNMQGMFQGCTGLTSLDLSSFNTSNVTNMDGMFNNCTGLTSLNLKNWNTNKVTNFNGMFVFSRNLETIYCNNTWTGASGATSSSMFDGCTSLVGAISYDRSKVDITYANPTTGYFTKIIAPTATYIGVSNVAKKVKDIYIGISNKAKKVKKAYIGVNGVAKLFYEAVVPQNTITFTYTSTNPSYPSGTVTFSGNDNCQQLRSFIVDTIGDGAYNATYRLVTGELSGNGYGSAYQLFQNCRGLTNLDVSELNTSNITDMSYMFGCSTDTLTTIDVSHFDTSNVSEGLCFQFMFSGLSGITSIDVSQFDTSNANNIAGMFVNCSSLASINLSSFNTSNVTNMTNVFSGCSNLTSLNLNNFDTSNVTSIGGMFNNCTSLTTIFCNNSWNGASGVDSYHMFYGCTNLVGAISYAASKTDITYANPTTGYFTGPIAPEIPTTWNRVSDTEYHSDNGIKLTTSGIDTSFYALDKAADGVATSKSQVLLSVGTTGWIQFEFPSAVNISTVKIALREATSGNFNNAKWQGSNDNSTWTDLANATINNFTLNTYTYTGSNYKYYRLLVNGNNASYSPAWVVDIQT